LDKIEGESKRYQLIGYLQENVSLVNIYINTAAILELPVTVGMSSYSILEIVRTISKALDLKSRRVF
jgi:hypothetical protein